MTSRFDSRQSIHTTTLDQLSNDTGIKLDTLLNLINDELTPPLRLRKDPSASNRRLYVGPIEIQTLDSSTGTGRKKTIQPINNTLPNFTGGYIEFPAAGGGSITANGITLQSAYTLTVPSNNYIKVMLALGSNGNIYLSFGTPNANESSATLPLTPSGPTALGYVTLFNNSSNQIQNVDDTKIYQFIGGGGSGGGGSVPEEGAIYSDGSSLQTTNSIYANETNGGLVSTEAQNFAGWKTFLDLTVTNNLIANGLPPVGSIIAYNPGFYTGSNNTGFQLQGVTFPINAANVNAALPASWRVCDGAEYSNAASPIWNGTGRFLPNLGDDRFLRGTITTPANGGAKTKSIDHTHSVTTNVTIGDHTLSIANMPTHSHTMTHTHASWTPAATGGRNSTHYHGAIGAIRVDSVGSDYGSNFTNIMVAGGGTYGFRIPTAAGSGVATTIDSNDHTHNLPTLQAPTFIGDTQGTGLGTSFGHSVTNNSVTSSGASVGSINVEPNYLSTIYIVRVY